MIKYVLINHRVAAFKQVFVVVLALLSLQLMLFSPLSGLVESVFAQGGGLQIVPTRIIFEGRDRSARVNLINHGNTTETYRISFKNMRMLINGDYQDIEEPGASEKFADSLIRYSPRQVTLKPGESQAVRLLLRKKKGLEAGEYRSHLFFRTTPPKNLGESLEKLDIEQDEIAVKLIPIFGITIPVIVRHGKGSVSVKIEGAELENSEGEQKLLLHLSREGTFSTFGEIAITLGAGGSDTVISTVRGIAIYTPNKTRTVRLKLDNDTDLKGKTLHVVYRNIPEKGGDIIAETDIQIP